MGHPEAQDLEQNSSMESLPFLEQTYPSKQDRSWGCILKRCAIDAFFIVLCTSLFTFLLNRSRIDQVPNAIPGLNVSYLKQAFTSLGEGHWVGPDQNEKWEKLLAPNTIRVTDEELYAQDQHPKSMSLPDGGHLAWLGVFHDLHCLNHVRQTLHGTEREDLVHDDHCIDHIRQQLMCHPDVYTINVFGFDKMPVFKGYRPERTCVDWDVLVRSLESRHVTRQEIQRKTGFEPWQTI